MKEVSFVVYVDSDVRIRHRHMTHRGTVRRFAVQVEVRVGNTWRPVIRYDSAHGEAHRHVFTCRGHALRESLGLSLEGGLTFAQEDLQRNWRRYVERFRGGTR